MSVGMSVSVHMCVSMFLWLWGSVKLSVIMLAHLLVGMSVQAAISSAANTVYAALDHIQLMPHCCICWVCHTTICAAYDIQMYMLEILLHVFACVIHVCTSECVNICTSGCLDVSASVCKCLHGSVHKHSFEIWASVCLQLFVCLYVFVILNVCVCVSAALYIFMCMCKFKRQCGCPTMWWSEQKLCKQAWHICIHSLTVHTYETHTYMESSNWALYMHKHKKLTPQTWFMGHGWITWCP